MKIPINCYAALMHYILIADVVKGKKFNFNFNFISNHWLDEIKYWGENSGFIIEHIKYNFLENVFNKAKQLMQSTIV